MANNSFEAATNALCFFQEDKDECDIAEKMDYAFRKVLDMNADYNTDAAYIELAGLYEQKGYRDGFAAGIKFIMQAMGR